jgi:hypothetical protein
MFHNGLGVVAEGVDVTDVVGDVPDADGDVPDEDKTEEKVVVPVLDGGACDGASSSTTAGLFSDNNLEVDPSQSSTEPGLDMAVTSTVYLDLVSDSVCR